MALFTAIENDNLKQLERLYKKHPMILQEKVCGYSLSYLAVICKSYKALEWILERPPHVLRSEKYHHSCLPSHGVPTKDIRRCIKYLSLEESIHPYHAPNADEIRSLEIIQRHAPETLILGDMSGFTPMHVAAIYEYWSRFEWLAMHARESLFMQDMYGNTPGHYMLRQEKHSQKMDRCISLVRQCAPSVFGIRNMYGYTMMHLLALSHRVKIFTRLCPFIPTTLGARDQSRGCSPLHLIASCCDVDMFVSICGHAPQRSLFAKNFLDKTPLDIFLSRQPPFRHRYLRYHQFVEEEEEGEDEEGDEETYAAPLTHDDATYARILWSRFLVFELDLLLDFLDPSSLSIIQRHHEMEPEPEKECLVRIVFGILAQQTDFLYRLSDERQAF
jgi:hypothetical protein